VYGLRAAKPIVGRQDIGMSKFLKLPTTIVEWVVIAVLIFGLGIFFFAPYLDDGVTAARKKHADHERASRDSMND
jgi:hypothetical protein